MVIDLYKVETVFIKFVKEALGFIINSYLIKAIPG